MRKRILITGGTGFIGSELCKSLSGRGDDVTVLSRNAASVSRLCGETIKGISSLDDIEEDASFDAIINLAGAPIVDKRWSNDRKRLLISSRVGTTKGLINFVEERKLKVECLISGSAVGFYGDQGDREVDEETMPHDEFTHHLCREWEEEALKAEKLSVRVCIVRTGLVVGKGGGFLNKMLFPFKLGLGGRLGDGNQWMPWIHMDDLTGLILYLVDHREFKGVFNGTAPNPARNAEFTRTLSELLHRPALLPLPVFFLKLLMGEMSRLLTTGQRAVPRAAMSAGFNYKYKDLKAALLDVLN